MDDDDTYVLLVRPTRQDRVIAAVAAVGLGGSRERTKVASAAVEHCLSHKRRRVGSGGQKPWRLTSLLEALLLTRLLKNACQLPAMLVRAVAFILGHSEAHRLKEAIDQRQISLPSKSTLSKTRIRLDLVYMWARQQLWAESNLDQGTMFVGLSSDSSPQGGSDYLMTLEDAWQRKICSSSQAYWQHSSSTGLGGVVERLSRWTPPKVMLKRPTTKTQ